METTTLPEAPESIRAISSIPDPDYTDTYTHEAADASDWTPEEWARVCFNEIAGFKAWLMWRFMLRMKLRWWKSSGTICGWRIDGQGPDWIRLESDGHRFHGNLVYRITDGQAQLATIVKFKRPEMAVKWQKLQPTHNGVVPSLVAETHKRLRDKAS
ncbi:hypothetical protein [Stackebrandtia nassauensis]|nr:hypothetical protein [Stackebrandtia nassauensis]